MTVWLATALALLPAVEPPVQEATTVDFEGLSAQFREAHGISDQPGDTTLEDALQSDAFVRVRFATVEVYAPAKKLADKKIAKRFQEAVLVVVDAERSWISWSDAGRDGYDDAMDDFKKLRGWVKSWSAGALSKGSQSGSSDLLDVLKAKDPVREASARLHAFVKKGMLETSGSDKGTMLLLAPDRESFILSSAFVGWYDDVARTRLWTDGIVGSNAAWGEVSQIVCLENPAWPPDVNNLYAGASLNDRDKTGFAQHVSERLITSLLYDYFAQAQYKFFETALATNVVIDVCGKNELNESEWSYDLQRQGVKVEGESRFVPGGASGGGTLPRRKAGPARVMGSASPVSHWNKTAGSDYFIKPLREAQKAGFKQAGKQKASMKGNKIAHFEVRDDKGGKRHAVTAPFLGQAAETKPIPPFEFLDDYEDFFRAYRSAFFHWLRTEAAGKESEALFGELIRVRAASDAETPFYQVVADVYGQPMSGEDDSTENLEWRFLTWLSKQK